MKELKIKSPQEFKTNQDQERDFHLLYEDSCAKYYDEGEVI